MARVGEGRVTSGSKLLSSRSQSAGIVTDSARGGFALDILEMLSLGWEGSNRQGRAILLSKGRRSEGLVVTGKDCSACLLFAGQHSE